jgi:hypothetical protein
MGAAASVQAKEEGGKVEGERVVRITEPAGEKRAVTMRRAGSSRRKFVLEAVGSTDGDDKRTARTDALNEVEETLSKLEEDKDRAKRLRGESLML